MAKMRKDISGYLSLAAVLAAFVMLAVKPAEASAGAVRGLEVCAGIILPSLFPFLLLSGMLSRLGLPALLERLAGPLLTKLFRIPARACAPLILGLTGGYPVGAAALAQLVDGGGISSEEAGRILPFCNNTGPAFILGAAGSGVFGSVGAGLLLYASHIAAALILGAVSAPRRAAGPAPAGTKPEAPPFSQVLAQSMKNAVGSAVNICGYVVFFSCLRALLDAFGLFSAAAGVLAARSGLGLHFSRSLLTGLLELGSGISSMQGLAPEPLNLALASFILGFGSLSVHCQTLAVVRDANIKCGRHFAGRLLHGLISALLTFLLSSLIK